MPPPDASIAPTSGAGLTDTALMGSIAASEKNITAAAAGERKAAEKGVSELSEISKESKASAQSFDQIIAGLKPPELGKPPADPTYTQTNPIKAWGSAAMMVAALASLFTRTPLTTAFKSAGAALDAFREGDQARANAAFSKWKIDTENFFKMADYQQRSYEALLGSVENRARLMRDEYSDEAANLRAELSTLGQAFGDTMVANADSLHTQLRILTERQRQEQFMSLHGASIEQAFDYRQAMTDWEAKFRKDNHRPPTGEERVEEAGRLRQTMGHTLNETEIDSSIQRSNGRAATFAKNIGYTGMQANLAGILEYDPTKPPGAGEVIRQGQALDKFVQSINGNRAIRGFQLKLLQDHAGLYNQFQIGLQALGRGGSVTPQMIQTMQELARVASSVLTLQYGEYITSEQWQHHKAMGVDPTEFEPPDFDRSLAKNDDGTPMQWPTPPQAAIDILKAPGGDTRQNWIYFDQHYGPGAAASVFSQQGP